jgi:hypothetical protein
MLSWIVSILNTIPSALCEEVANTVISKRVKIAPRLHNALCCRVHEFRLPGPLINQWAKELAGNRQTLAPLAILIDSGPRSIISSTASEIIKDLGLVDWNHPLKESLVQKLMCISAE